MTERVSEIFGKVDPGLTVISGGMRRRTRKKKAKKLVEIREQALGPYHPTPMSREEWEKAQGEVCPICSSETQQLLPYGFTGKRKACKQYIERRTKLLEYKARVVAPKFGRR